MLLSLLAATVAGQTPATRADAWAHCIWQSVPTSAAHWIEMPVDRPAGYQSNSQFQRLKFRLRSACWDQLMPAPSKPDLIAEPFDALLVRDALIRSKPQQIMADRLDPAAWVCQAYNGNQLVAEYFNSSADLRVKLQKSMGHGVSRMDCSYISTDGSLKPHA